VAQIFFTNTAEGPFGGLREEWSTRFETPRSDGPLRVTVHPFWESLGTVSRLRFDPPAGEFGLEAIRILAGAPTPETSRLPFPSTASP